MYRIVIAAIACLLLASCTSTEPFFKLMSVDELAHYNTTMAFDDRVYCFDEVRTGSHIKRRFCGTVAELTSDLKSDSNYLGVLNYGGGTGYRRPTGFGID